MQRDNTRTVELQPQLLVESEGKYEIAGYPGVGIGAIRFRSNDFPENPFEQYNRVASSVKPIRASCGASLKEIEDRTLDALEIDSQASPFLPTSLYLGTHAELIRFENKEMAVLDCLTYFNSSGPFYSFILVANTGGEVFHGKDKGLRYYLHSNEQGHNEPHVHVSYYHDDEASISILTCKVIVGKLPGRALRAAIKRIKSNQEYLFKCWRDMTNGDSRILPIPFRRRLPTRQISAMSNCSDLVLLTFFD